MQPVGMGCTTKASLGAPPPVTLKTSEQKKSRMCMIYNIKLWLQLNSIESDTNRLWCTECKRTCTLVDQLSMFYMQQHVRTGSWRGCKVMIMTKQYCTFYC